METINIYEAKTQLSRIVDDVVAGADVVIAKANKPMVRVVPFEPQRQIRFGVLKGIRVPDDLDAPLADDVLASFAGGR
jgi:prevent-host-death family protein